MGGPPVERLSAARQKFAGPSGLKGIIHNGKPSAIALFASLGGLVYGYNQGMFAQVLTMHSFIDRTNGFTATTGLDQGMLTVILELGAWVGTLINGYLADAVGRRIAAVIASAVFCVGVIVQPLSMRARGVSIGGGSNWLNNFAIGLSTSPFIQASTFGTFIFFGCITVVGAVWVFFLVPETKGKTLEEMDELFGQAGFASADLALKTRIEREIGLTALLGLNDGTTDVPFGNEKMKAAEEHGEELVEEKDVEL